MLVLLFKAFIFDKIYYNVAQNLNMNELTLILEDIILSECERLLGSQCRLSEVIDLPSRESEYDKTLSKNDIISIISKHNVDNAQEYFNQIKDTFLIEFPNEQYRTVYTDLMYKTVNLRTKKDYPSYVIKPRLILAETIIPDPEDRRLNISETETPSLYSVLLKNLGDNTKDFINVVKKYLEIKRYSGIDIVQAEMLKQLIETSDDSLVEAPTGFGKTEVFLFYLLYQLIKNNFDPTRKILLVYPRKALAIDQTNRLITLATAIKKVLNKDVSIVIRDGESQKDRGESSKPIRDGNIKCPNNHGINPDSTCEDPTCDYHNSFKIFDTKNVRGKNPLVVVSNIQTVANRLLTCNEPQDIDFNYLENFSTLILDEVHVYHGVFGGIVSVVLKRLKEVNPSLRIIGVSATIPGGKKFGEELFNGKVREISAQRIVKKQINKKQRIRGKKLYIVNLVEVKPDVSWQTFSQLWSIISSTYSLIYLRKNENKLYQTIAFINNVSELLRFKSGVEQNIGIGEPCNDRVTNTPDPKDTFSIYDPTGSCNQQSNSIGNVIRRNFDIAFMDSVDKYSTFRNIASGSTLLTGSTSSLELGVDYDGVSFILNGGVDDYVEIVQRLGRASRGGSMPKIAQAVIISKNLPVQSYKINDRNAINTFIRMLSGENRGRVSPLRVTKNVRPVIMFDHLSREVTKLFRDGCVKSISSIQLKKMRESVEKSHQEAYVVEFFKNMENTLGERGERSLEERIEQCSSMLDPYYQFWDEIEDLLSKLGRKLDDMRFQLNVFMNEKDIEQEIKKDLSEIINISIEIKEYKSRISSYFSLNEIQIEFEKILKVIRDKLRDLSEKLAYIYDIVVDSQASTHSEIKEKLGKQLNENEKIVKELYEKTRSIINNFWKYAGKRISSDEKLKCLSLFNFMGSSDSARDFVFAYSNISGGSLQRDTTPLSSSNLNVVYVDKDGYERSLSHIQSNFYSLIYRFSPFSVIDISKLTRAKSYALTLFGIDFKRGIKYDPMNDRIHTLLTTPIPKNNHRLKISKIEKYKLIDLFHVSKLFESSLKIIRKDNLFIKYWADPNLIRPDYALKLKSEYNSKYDPSILNYVHYCMIGRAISTDYNDFSCPFVGECSIGKIISRNNRCRFWYYSMKVFPKSYVLSKNNILWNIPSTKAVSPIFLLNIHNNIEIIKTFDDVLLYLNDYPVRIPLYPVLWDTFYSTNLISIKIDKKISKILIQQILSSNPKLRDVLATKFAIYSKNQNTYKAIKELRPEDLKTIRQDDLIDFAYKVLLHTLSHLFLQFIENKFELEDMEVTYGYDTEKEIIYIFENNYNGANDLPRLVRNIGENKLVEQFLKFSYAILHRHSVEARDYNKYVLITSRRRIMSSGSNEDRKILRQELRQIEKLKPLRLDWNSFKLKLINDFSKKDVNEYLNLSDVALGYFCLDGCSSCVMIDNCSDPIHQNLTTSRVLTRIFLKQIRMRGNGKDFSSPTLQLSGDSNVGFSLLDKAKEIDITTAYIDESCIQKIKELLNQEVKVRLILDEENNKAFLEEHKNEIEELRNKGLEIAFKSTHEKEYIVRRNEGYEEVITGSWNCGKSSRLQNFTISIREK